MYDPSWQTVEYHPDDSIERTWDNPYVRQGGWRFERIREVQQQQQPRAPSRPAPLPSLAPFALPRPQPRPPTPASPSQDKKLPNDISTVKSVEVSVRDGVTAPELLEALRIQAHPATLGAFAPSGMQGAHAAAHPPPTPQPPPEVPAAVQQQQQQQQAAQQMKRPLGEAEGEASGGVKRPRPAEGTEEQ